MFLVHPVLIIVQNQTLFSLLSVLILNDVSLVERNAIGALAIGRGWLYKYQ